jgi:hypothetical protein
MTTDDMPAHETLPGATEVAAAGLEFADARRFVDQVNEFLDRLEAGTPPRETLLAGALHEANRRLLDAPDDPITQAWFRFYSEIATGWAHSRTLAELEDGFDRD